MDRSQPKTRVPQFAALTAAALVVGTAGWSFAAPVPQPLVQYAFNEGTGTTAANSGSASNANLTLTSNTFTATGTGVSGNAGDSAMLFGNNTSSSLNFGQASNPVLSGQASFTIQGWYNTAAGKQPAGNIIYNGLDNLYFKSAGASAGFVDIHITGASGAVGDYSNTTAYTLGGGSGSGWIFFAITYDGTKTSNNLIFYEGTTTTGVQVIGTSTANLGTLKANPNTLMVGNTSTQLPPNGNQTGFAFNSKLDDFRIFGAADGSGALSVDQLNTIRTADVAGTSVPEPASAAVAGLFGLAMLGTRRRG